MFVCRFGPSLSEIRLLVFVIDDNRYRMSLDLFAYVNDFGDFFSVINNKKFHCRSLLQGKSSHKFIDMSENPIMSVYYTNRTVLFLMCFGNEAFYATLYLIYFTSGPTVLGIPLFYVILYLAAPVALVKSGISLLHLVVASRNLAIIDVNERKAAKEKNK